ncbi:ankyrin repeat domain-containing protein [Psychrobacter frigidicola]|uniref:Ankyrin repeat domain-containing protein n=1 Tax=Psychrobacter frigidicola TaxID=45611 RepID=A0A5C7A359_9GAMM|nr:ankyrin repeat domain-containing protein [Psychrobacter frigidicola]TXD98047.1 ankyrin repeat domain-containing protein [Psychrobacter frigidicola]
MKLAYKMSASAVLAAMLLTGCSSLDTETTDKNDIKKDEVVQSSQTVPTPQTDFRFSAAENADIANKDKLSYRVFYAEPTKGVDGKWFDAIKHGDLASVKYMVKNGQDLEAKDTDNLDQTALGWAAFIGYEDIVDYLIGEGASIYATDRGDVYNVMKSAALGKNTNVVKKVHELLNTKAPVDLNDQTQESDGETLIMVAASNNRLETVKYLLSKGANPNLVATTKDKTMGSYNQGAYSYACTRGHVEVQQLLKENGAINHRTGKASCE